VSATLQAASRPYQTDSASRFRGSAAALAAKRPGSQTNGSASPGTPKLAGLDRQLRLPGRPPPSRWPVFRGSEVGKVEVCYALLGEERFATDLAS